MINEKQENYIVVDIPVNFETGLQIKNFDFKPSFLLQAIIISFFIGIIIFGIIQLLFSKLINFTSCISVAIGLAIICGIMLYQGFNRESPLGFFLNIIQFHKRKRIALNNPRIKKEWSPYTDSNDDAAVLPRDRLIALYNDAKEIYDKKMQEKAKNNEMVNQKIEYIFADDVELDQKLAKKSERKNRSNEHNLSYVEKLIQKLKKEGVEEK